MGRPKPAASPAKKGGRGSTKAKAKKEKDPNAPKKPTTAFFYFVKHRRLQGADQGLKVSEFTKECGALWRDLTTDDKEKFDGQASDDRERYRKAMAIYKPSSVADPNEPPKPKKPQTAFILFTNEMRPKLQAQGFDAKNVLVESGRLWKGMDEEEKVDWAKGAAIEKGKYEKAMEKYNEQLKQIRAEGGASTQNGGSSKPASKPAAPAPDSDEEEEMDDEEEEDEVESDDE